MDVQLLYFEDCPSWQDTAAHLQTLASEIDGLTITNVVVNTPELAEHHNFRGSPSIKVDGTDPFSNENDPVGLSCRIYQTPEGPAGTPTLSQLRSVLQPR
jgi:hypothetical protein